MPMFQSSARLIKTINPEAAATLEIQTEMEFSDSEKAMAAIERMLFIPGTYEVYLKWREDPEAKLKTRTCEIIRTAQRIALDLQSPSSTS